MREHQHPVFDTDAHFEINTITRNIDSVSGKSALIQGDHNSERFTFELSSRYIEGHDMSLSNVVQIHYINIDAVTKAQNIGVYEVDDMEISKEDENKVVFSWLISNNATLYAGSLSFIIKFKCVNDDGVAKYVWNSSIYEGISISNGIDNGEQVETEYVDILAQWSEKINAMEAAVDDASEVHSFYLAENSGVGWYSEMFEEFYFIIPRPIIEGNTYSVSFNGNTYTTTAIPDESETGELCVKLYVAGVFSLSYAEGITGDKNNASFSYHYADYEIGNQGGRIWKPVEISINYGYPTVDKILEELPTVEMAATLADGTTAKFTIYCEAVL